MDCRHLTSTRAEMTNTYSICTCPLPALNPVTSKQAKQLHHSPLPGPLMPQTKGSQNDTWQVLVPVHIESLPDALPSRQLWKQPHALRSGVRNSKLSGSTTRPVLHALETYIAPAFAVSMLSAWLAGLVKH